MRSVVIGLLLAGCGRFSFEQRSDATGGDDAANDGSSNGDGGSDALALATTCGTFTSRMCDGFETGALDLQRWIPGSQAGSVTVDSAHAYRGTFAFHAHTNALASSDPTAYADLRTSQGLMGQITGTAYVRAWTYFASPHPGIETDQILNFADNAGKGISVEASGGFMVSNDYTSGILKTSMTVQLPVDRWFCLELAIPSNTAGSTRVFVDGAEVVDARITKASVQPPPDHVYIGIDWYSNNSTLPAVDAWFDEIVIDDKLIDCAL